jgi:hypothetical protein
MEAKEDSMKKTIAWLLLALFAFMALATVSFPVVHADPGELVNPVPPKP